MLYFRGFAAGYFLAMFYFGAMLFSAKVEMTAAQLVLKAVLWPQTFSFVFNRTVKRADEDSEADGAE